ncbi:MAG: DUF4274 domain-containing protein [Rhizobiales bacterium]|nr:DUF4274 domain-containing protein [Hyphomicrobiales bacterium]
MWFFGRKRTSRAEELARKFNEASKRYARERDLLTPAESQAFGVFFRHIRDGLREAGAAEFAQLPVARLDTLLSVHAAIFEDDAAFATTLPGRSAAARAFLSDLRAESAALRQPRAARPAPTPPVIPASAGKIDLESLLGPRDPDTRRARLLGWLERQPPQPDLWHEIAVNSDPDGMDEIFLWIVRQPDCDAATAAHIFHANNSFEALDAGGRIGPARVEIATIVARRWAANDFARYELGFEERGYEEPLASYRAREAEAAARGEAPAFAAPEGLFAFRPGRAPDTPYFYSDFERFEG